MPHQDTLPIPELYNREWVDNTTQRVDEGGNLMWEKQSAKDRKAGIEPTPVLNFPAGGYFKYTAKDKLNLNEDSAIMYYEVPQHYTDAQTGKDYKGVRGGTGEFKAVGAIEKRLAFAREHLKKIDKERIAREFKAYQLEQFDGDEGAYDAFRQQVKEDWTRETRFEGGLGFMATTIPQGTDADYAERYVSASEGGRLPGSLADTRPAGYYWKRDADGNDIWVNGRRVPAPLYEGKGALRPGKVAKHLETHGRSGMYGGKEDIDRRLEEKYIQNDSYIGHLAEKYAPDTTGADLGIVPPQTPLGEEDQLRADGTKATRDWTWHNIISVNPEEYTMGDPYKYWLASSEGQLEMAEREKWLNEMKRDFSKWMYKQFVEEQAQHKGTFLEGKTIPWGAVGISFDNRDAEAWRRAKGAKKELYELYEAQHKASLNKGLDEPSTQDMGGIAVQSNGIVLDTSGRPTGQVVDAPEDMDSEDEDIDDWFAEGGSDEEIVVERVDGGDDDFEDDADTYGRRITSGTGKQLRWDAGK